MYQKLRIYGYNNFHDIDNEYKRRFDNYGSIKTNLTIKPYSVNKQQKELEKNYELFINIIPKILKLFEKLFTNSKFITELSDSIPQIALQQLTINMLINEIKSTNDIEGVKSTRKEINDAFRSNKKLRFTGIVNSYSELMNTKLKKIKTVEDIRSIYDTLLDDEIDENSLPDGHWFRKDSVYIREGDKKVHEGVYGEKNIIDNLNQLILYMNSDHSYLIKACVTHYFFEYIHPFYDGNGRMGRFLLSAYLSRKLDHLTGLSVSQAVFAQRKKYEDSFMEASNPRNYGELTHFVIDLLEIISQGQKNLISQLNDSQAKLKNAEKYLKQLGYNDKETNLLYILFQNYLFGLDSGYLSNMDLAKMDGLSLSRTKINNITKEFEDKGILEIVSKKPTTYKLTPKIIEHLE